MNSVEFCEFLGPAAYELEQRRRYPMEVVMTQVHLETGGLEDYPAGSNNALGIKWDGEGGPENYVVADTWEFRKGQWVREPARFQRFTSLLECLERWADLMDKPVYAQAQPFRDPENWPAFLALIWHNGETTVYATDPMYLWKAVKRAAEVGIPTWCAAYRAHMQAPTVIPMTCDFFGRVLDGYRIDGDKLTGPVRPTLDVLTERTGAAWHVDVANRRLTVWDPRSKATGGEVQ